MYYTNNTINTHRIVSIIYENYNTIYDEMYEIHFIWLAYYIHNRVNIENAIL